MASRKPLILVVDDDPPLVKLLTWALELEGYEVIAASDGQTGLRLIEDEDVALVLLDVVMPGLDGFDICERARQFSEVPIIMVTAKAWPWNTVRALAVGADDYVVKPLDVPEFLARVKAALR
ncbi:MAG: response regulator [Dehalococcoidia bacterium]|nr:response regulator [Dehalococcoidia bacterium]